MFLDKELRVKRFTPASTRLLSLIPSDLGRPVADVLRRFADEMLLDDARRVLTELTPLAKEVQADDGRWYFRRITPYRTQDDRIEGVVLTFVDVSDIKQAEQAMRASEKKYRDLAESANSVIIRWKPDGEITYVNRYGLSFFGYREEEILGRNAMILVPGRDSSGLDLSGLTAAIVEHPERYVSNENENVLADGRRVWVQWTNKAILDEAGNTREILAIGNDITERKRAEEDLRLAHLRMSWLARFPEENPNPVLRVSAEGENLYCNPAAMELDGWKCEIGRPMPDPVLPLVMKAMAKGREVVQDVDLGERTYSVAVTSFAEEGYANVYGRDITERKQAEEKLRRNEAMLRSVLDQMPSGVTVRDAQSGELILSSPRSREIMGALVDVPEQFTPCYRGLHADGRPYRTEEWPIMRSMNTGEVVNVEEIECERSDGARIVLSMSSAPIRDSQGKIVMGVGIFHDVTGRKRAEEELRESETKYRNLFENITEEVHFWKLARDASGRITTWRLVDANPPTLKTWGKTLDEIKGKTTDEIFGPGASEHYMPVVRKIMEEGVPYGFEDYFPHLDKYFRFTSVPLGEYFITTGSDITSLKKIEQSLRQSREDLDHAQAVGQIGSWRLDIRRNVLTWSDENHRIFGVPQGHAADLRDVPGASFTPTTAGTWTTQWQAAWPASLTTSSTASWWMGQVKWVREKAYLEFDGAGKLLGGFGITQDITDASRQEESCGRQKMNWRSGLKSGHTSCMRNHFTPAA